MTVSVVNHQNKFQYNDLPYESEAFSEENLCRISSVIKDFKENSSYSGNPFLSYSVLHRHNSLNENEIMHGSWNGENFETSPRNANFYPNSVGYLFKISSSGESLPVEFTSDLQLTEIYTKQKTEIDRLGQEILKKNAQEFLGITILPNIASRNYRVLESQSQDERKNICKLIQKEEFDSLSEMFPKSRVITTSYSTKLGEEMSGCELDWDNMKCIYNSNGEHSGYVERPKHKRV